ncbi:hypothetical protein, partial [Falsigemmobacter intermedius]|uniref:hypothetical protein n=1 Tax=Falsigemmobacter intermedius TaxID=1553448 RepID=UPI003F04B0F8
HKENTLTDMLEFLNTNPACSFDFYLLDNDGEIFTFSYRPKGYHVMSLPYRIINRFDPKEILEEFRAVYGWGAGEDSPPPNSIDEIKASTSLASSPFIRYSEGKFTPGSRYLE